MVEEIQIENKDNRVKLIKIITVIVFVFILIATVYYKIQNPDFSLKLLLLLIFFITVVALILFFGFDIYKKFEKIKEKVKDEEVNNPVSEEILKFKIKNIIESKEFENHVRKFIYIKPHNVGKNLIYDFCIEPAYIDGNKKRINIIINANYADRIPAILFNASEKEIRKCVNSCSSTPDAAGDREERTERDLSSGKEIIYKKITQNKKPIIIDKPKTEDLA